jgi:hypothetical protein
MERREQHTKKTLRDYIDTQLFMSPCIVGSRERNPQVLGRLLYGKQIVNRSFAHSLKASWL